MIPDDAEADADALDDATLLQALLGTSADAAESHIMPDWPRRSTRTVSLSLEPDVLEWFQAHHTDWRHEIQLVLRAWVIARQRAPGARTSGLA